MASSLEPTDDLLQESFLDDFSCKICLEILRKPMQCQLNEHYFCATCITKHLDISPTCPMCMDELTPETLRAAPRVIANVASQFKIPRCDHVQRGCKDTIQLEDLPFHHKVCAFAPVLCSNQGCNETLNRRDKESHERTSCMLRKTECEVCNEEMAHRNYATHRCSLKKEIDELTLRLKETTDMLQETRNVQRKHAQCIEDLQDPLRSASSAQFRQERAILVNGQIIVAGGHRKESKKSIDVFNWSTKTWTLFKNALFFERFYSFSFVFGKKIMICGGEHSNRIECFNPNENAYTSSVFPGVLKDESAKGVLCKNRVITFGSNVHANLLEPPWSSDDLLRLPSYRNNYGVECFDDQIVLVGGNAGADSPTDMSVQAYDEAQNRIRELSSLPYKVSKMATVPYKDSIILIGGQDENNLPLNSVIMYNLKTEECKRLPSMLEKRSGCAAVIVGDLIVVVGGCSQNPGQGIKRVALSTVEYYILDHDAWKELPAMHLEREGATACVSQA